MIPSWTDDEVYLVAVRGHSLFLQGRYAESATIFEGLHAVRPRDLYCANALAALYIQMGQIQRAIDILSEALASQPDHVETRARRCEAYVIAGRQADARRDGEILRRAPDSTPARLEILLGISRDI
jgi:Flp pilus assembly protein TadD